MLETLKYSVSNCNKYVLGHLKSIRDFLAMKFLYFTKLV